MEREAPDGKARMDLQDSVDPSEIAEDIPETDADLDAAILELEAAVASAEPAPEAPIVRAEPAGETESEPKAPEPESAPTPDSDDVPPAVPARARAARVPLALYGSAWIALAAATFVLLRTAQYPHEAPEYRYVALAGVALVAASPLVWLVEWLLSRHDAEDRRGIVMRTMLWTAGIAAVGMSICIAVLTLLDALRLGWL